MALRPLRVVMSGGVMLWSSAVVESACCTGYTANVCLLRQFTRQDALGTAEKCIQLSCCAGACPAIQTLFLCRCWATGAMVGDACMLASLPV
jgi:hypothetical protein